MNIAESAQTKLLNLIEVAVSRSTQKLSEMSGTNWNVYIISIDVGSGERFRSILARDKNEYLGVHFSSPGERYLVMFSGESKTALLNSSGKDFPEWRRLSPNMEVPILSEIANVIINELSGELADQQGMARIISGPTAIRSTKAEIYNRAFSDHNAVGEGSMVNALIRICSPSLAADCTLMVRLDPLSTNFLLNTDPDALPVLDPA